MVSGVTSSFFSPSLYFTDRTWPSTLLDRLLDIGVGHLALRHQVPIIMALAGAAHRFREDMDLDGLLGAVLRHHASRADEHALLDVGHFGRDDHDKQWIVGQCQPQLRAVAI